MQYILQLTSPLYCSRLSTRGSAREFFHLLMSSMVSVFLDHASMAAGTFLFRQCKKSFRWVLSTIEYSMHVLWQITCVRMKMVFSFWRGVCSYYSHYCVSHGVGMLSPLGMASQHGYGAIEMDDDKIPNAVVGRGITIQFSFILSLLDSLNLWY